MKTCLFAFSGLFIAMECYALWVNSRYKWDFIFVMLLWIVVYLARKRIDLHPVHFALFGLFLFLHFAGMFGWYQTYPLGMEYDYWVHGFFGFVACVDGPPRVLPLRSLSACFDCGGRNRLATWVFCLSRNIRIRGAMTVGEGEGVLFIGAGDLDEWDTQKDMLNNLIGGLLGVLVFHVGRYCYPQKSAS